MPKKKSPNSLRLRNSTAEFLTFAYQTGGDGVEVRVEEGTIWLSQKNMGLLFETTPENVLMHLKNIFAGQELAEDSVAKVFLATAADGKNYRIKHYNLDAIIAVGYRVNSKRATAFRQWATGVLRDYTLRGYVMDRKRMENGAFLFRANGATHESLGQRPRYRNKPHIQALKGRPNRCRNPSLVSIFTSFSARRTENRVSPTRFGHRSSHTWPRCFKTSGALPWSSTQSKTISNSLKGMVSLMTRDMYGIDPRSHRRWVALSVLEWIDAITPSALPWAGIIRHDGAGLIELNLEDQRNE